MLADNLDKKRGPSRPNSTSWRAALAFTLNLGCLAPQHASETAEILSTKTVSGIQSPMNNLLPLMGVHNSSIQIRLTKVLDKLGAAAGELYNQALISANPNMRSFAWQRLFNHWHRNEYWAKQLALETGQALASNNSAASDVRLDLAQHLSLFGAETKSLLELLANDSDTDVKQAAEQSLQRLSASMGTLFTQDPCISEIDIITAGAAIDRPETIPSSAEAALVFFENSLELP